MTLFEERAIIRICFKCNIQFEDCKNLICFSINSNISNILHAKNNIIFQPYLLYKLDNNWQKLLSIYAEVFKILSYEPMASVFFFF